MQQYLFRLSMERIRACVVEYLHEYVGSPVEL